MDTYIPDPEKNIIHYVTVDFTKRFVETPVHLVQYDSSLPILAITLLQSGNSFTIPEGATALLRYSKKDGTFIILDPLGASSDRSTVYFEAPYQMTVEYGLYNPIVELWIDEKNAASSSFTVVVDRNPVQNSDVESLSDYAALTRFRNEAETSAKNAAASEATALDAARNAAESEYNAAQSASASAASAAAAAQSATEAANSATASAISETNAAASEVRSEEILGIMQHLVEGGLEYLPVETLPTEGKDTKTVYLIQNDVNTVEEWLWTGEWKKIGALRETLSLDTTVNIEPEEWDSATAEVTKTVSGVTETNKVYVFSTSTSNYAYCKSQSRNQLTFGVLDGYNIPSNTVTFSIIIMNPK